MVTAADRVFTGIVTDISSGTLRPRDPVSERDLVARFGVSRTPVREAIKRLIERGFLEVGPKGVAIVLDFSNEDLQKLYDLRLHLEGYAAGLAAAHIGPAAVDELRLINRRFAKALAQRDLIQMLEVRAKFHAVAVHATHNRWLADVLVMLRDRAYVVRHFHWQDAARAARTVTVHDEMIDALAKRDAKRYRQLVTEQIRSGLEWYMKQLRPKPHAFTQVGRFKPTASRLRDRGAVGE